MRKTIIHGCEARGDGDTPYLTRYTLFESKYLQICLHYFHRSDSDEHHDHPWNFITIPLWRGYNEETIIHPHCELCGNKLKSVSAGYFCTNQRCNNIALIHVTDNFITKRIWPFIPYFHKAEHRHRVILIKEKPAITLVFMGRRRRAWGFFTKNGWVDFLKYFKINKC